MICGGQDCELALGWLVDPFDISFFDLQAAFAFGHRIDGLQYFGILLYADLLRILVAERGSVHLALQLLANPSVILGPVRLVELDALLEQVFVEISITASWVPALGSCVS